VTTAMIVLGILSWALMAILGALFLGRVNKLSRLKRPAASAVELSPVPLVADALLNATIEVARFPAAPARFVGRVKAMAAARTALAPASGHTAVVFHGMAGAGKTTCAVELAYRHRRDFDASAFWSAPTDPDQYGDALRLLVLVLEAQLAAHRLGMVQEIASPQSLERFLPTLTTVFADADLLLILDNLDTLLTPDGQWRDPRWGPLIGALTAHQGPSRVILTSRIMPTGLNPHTTVNQPVHALSRDESLWVVRRLPNLRALLHTVTLGRCVLTLAQGHPQLLELADAAAADPSRLAYQLADIEAAIDGAALSAFLTEGATKLNAEQLQQIVTAWITTVAATVPVPVRLLLQALCRMVETDRNAAVVGENWAALWRRLGQAGEPPPFAPLVAALTSAGLIAADDSLDPPEPVRYRMHPSVVEAIHAVTPEPVTAAVDAQLGAWWSAVVAGWAIEPPRSGKDISQFSVRASVAAAHYLIRQHDWDAASCLLDRALVHNSRSPATSLVVTPLLRRIVEATGALRDLVVLGSALRKVAPGEAETLLRRAYHQATTSGEYQFASTTAGELVTLLRDQGRLGEALTLAGQKIEHTNRAGFGSWTQLSDQGRRLQILNLLGDHEQVLIEVPALRARMAELPDQGADNDRVDPWNAREGVLDIGRLSAVALERWDEALNLNDEIVSTKRRRGAGPYEVARTRFNDYIPLLRLDRLADVDQLLRDCQGAFGLAGDVTRLAVVYGARADLAATCDDSIEATELQRAALRLWYIHPDPREISVAHRHLADYLSRTAGCSAEQRAHRLTASLIDHLAGDTSEFPASLGVLTSELRGDVSDPDAPTLPTTLLEIIQLVDADDGLHVGDLVANLCPDPAIAEHALTDLLTRAALSDQ
jgi:hypothetical protein